MKARWIFPSALLIMAAAPPVAPAQTRDADWPQYLGPTRDGVASGFSMPAAPRLVEVWRRPLPMGSSSIIVSGPRAFTLGSESGRDFVFALDAATGLEAWRSPIGPTHADAADGPASTPAAVGDLIIAIGSSCVVQAVRSSDGSTAWTHDLALAHKTPLAQRGGCGMSPIVSGPLVIVPTGLAEGARIVALDAATGRQAWTSRADAGSAGSHAEVLYYIPRPWQWVVTGLDAGSGAVRWQMDGDGTRANQVPLPLPGNQVLLQTWAGSTLFEVPTPGAGVSARRVWTTDAIGAGSAPPVHRDGYLYGFGGNSGEFMKCVEMSSGAVRWESRPYRGATVLVDRTIVLLSETSGLLRLVAAEPAAYRETARLQVLKPGAATHTPPSFARGHVFVRNLDEIVAVAVR